MNHLYTTFRLSKPTTKTWSSVFGYKPVNERAAMELGGMYAVLSIASTVDFSLDHIGGMIFDELQDAYFGDEEGTASMQRFEQTLHAVKLKIEQILDQEEKISASGLDLEMGVVVFRDSVLYGAVIGEAHIFVQRDNQLNEISGVLADPDMDGFMRSGSLRLTKGDRVLLATDNIDSDNTFEAIQADLNKVELESLNVSRGVALLIGYHAEPVAAEVAPILTPADEIEPSAEVVDDEKLANISEVDSDTEMEYTPIVPQPKSSRIKLPAFLQRRETSLKSSVIEAEDDFESDVANQDEYKSDLDRNFESTITTDENPYTDIDSQSEFGDWETEAELMSKSPSRFSKITGQAVSFSQKVGAQAVEKVRNVDWKGIGSQVRDTATGLVARARGQYTPSRGNPRLGGNYRRPRAAMYDPKRKRLVWAAVIIVGLIVIFGIRQTAAENDRRAKVTTLEQQINKLSVDVTQLKIDAETASASSQAEVKEEIVNSANTIIQDVKKLANDELATPSMKSKAQEVETNAQTAADRALRVKAITQPQIVNNLAANFPGATPSDIEFIDNRLYVADPGRNVVYRMDTQLGSQAAAVLSDLNQPYLLTTDTTNNLVVVDKNPDSVIGVMTTSNNSFRRISGLSLAVQGELGGIDIWTNKAMYAVSKANQAISRQTQVGQGYQTPSYNNPWRKDAEFAQAKDIHVDFQIYILIEGQGVKRYVNGQPDPINLRGILPSDESALKTASAFLVTPTKLYIADSVNQRVLLFVKDTADSKNFDYASQYKYRGDAGALREIKDIVVNTNENQLFVLAGTSVIRIDL